MTMARKKKLDKLSLDMIQCAKDGYGVNYGRWKAQQEQKPPVKDDTLPDGWKLCEYCRKPFKGKSTKRFCDEICRKEAYYYKNRDKIIEITNRCRKNRKAREAAANG
jgi:hypothetical protein